MASDETEDLWVHKTTVDLSPHYDVAGQVLFEALEAATEAEPTAWADADPGVREACREVAAAVLVAVLPEIVAEAISVYIAGRDGSLGAGEIEVEG